MMKKESIISEEKEDTYEKEIDRTPRDLAGGFHGTGRLLQQYRDPEYGTFVRRGTDRAGRKHRRAGRRRECGEATRELQTFNILYSQLAADFENLCNLTEPLLEVDTYGALAPAIAEDWGTEDGGLTWTFNLREGVKWVDMNANEKADCISRDFATSLEWVLNFHKNDSANTTMPLEMIEGANEYYEYTKTLSMEEAYALDASDGSKFMEMVGIELPDDYTIIYHCVAPKPYFDSVATYACLYPISQGLIDELGVDGVKAMNNETMWYNGCYTMTSYVQGNEKVFTKNPAYWDQDCFLFDTVTIRMVESTDIAFQLYQTGEVRMAPRTPTGIQPSPTRRSARPSITAGISPNTTPASMPLPQWSARTTSTP